MVDTSQAVVSSDGSKSELYDTTNIDVYVWLDDQCLAFIIFYTAVLQCWSRLYLGLPFNV